MPNAVNLPSTKISLIVCLLLVQTLPTLPFYFGAADSMALGTVLAAALIVLTCWIQAAVWTRLSLAQLSATLILPTLVLVLLIAFFLVHAVVAAHFEPMDLQRFAQTLFPLVFLVVGGVTFGYQIFAASDSDMDFAARVSFWFLCSLIVLRLLGAEPPSATVEKPVFPYTEPSHFALAFGPMLMYRATRAESARKLWWILFGVMIAAVLQSVSLMACCLLIAFVCRKLLLVAGIGMLVLVSGLPLEITYYTSRLDLSSDTHNLSSLVYLQGWEQIAESLRWSSGWGLGFEQLGSRETESIAGSLIRAATGQDSNLRDGSFVMVKLVSEFGIFAALFVIAFAVMAVSSITALRNQRMAAASAFSRCLVATYLVDMFLRGTGYFTESTLLFVAGFAALQLERRDSTADLEHTSPDSVLNAGSL